MTDVREKLGYEKNDRAFNTTFKTQAETIINNKYNGDVEKLTVNDIVNSWPLSKKTTEVSNIARIQEYVGKWTRLDVASPENQDKLFIFTDNTDRDSGNPLKGGVIDDNSWYAKRYGRGKRYPSGTNTSAVIRGLDNARPISTQRYYHLNATREKGRWTNADAEEFKRVVHAEVDDIIEAWNTGKYKTIIFPQGGLLAETGITDLNGEDRTIIKKILEEEVQRIFKAVGMENVGTLEQFTESEEKKRNRLRNAERKERQEKLINARKWNTKAEEGQGYTIGLNGDEFGRQFSTLTAVFNENTPLVTITIGSGKNRKEQTLDVSGMSIEAAFQLFKGYTKNPKGPLADKNGKRIYKHIEGEGKAPVSDFLKRKFSRRGGGERQDVDDTLYDVLYKPLWVLWKKQNEDLFKELKKKSKGKILVCGGNSTLNPARVIAELMYGTKNVPATEYIQEMYDKKRELAVQAGKKITAEARKIKVLKNTQGVDRNAYSEQEIAYLLEGKDKNGNPARISKKYAVAFNPVRSRDVRFDANSAIMYNPFEGEKDALRKYVEWLIPNEYESLPRELQKEQELRDKLRTNLAMGNYKNHTILYDRNSKDSEAFVKLLRYLVDNFRDLRDTYNPINIMRFGDLRHNIRVETEVRDGNSNQITRFSPKEYTDRKLDNINSVTIERISDKDGNLTDNFILSFPAEFDKNFTDEQKQRLYKTIIMAIPAGCTLTMDGVVMDSDSKAFDMITKYGFRQSGIKEITREDGTTGTVGVWVRNKHMDKMVSREDKLNIKTIKEDTRENTVFLLEVAETKVDEVEKTGKIIGVPVVHAWDTRLSKANLMYWDDSQFDIFKRKIDSIVERAKKAIDSGKKVVLPKGEENTGNLGLGTPNLRDKAPKLFEYLNEKIQEIEKYGNEEAMADQYINSKTANVKVLDSAPEVKLDPTVLQSKRAQLRTRFTDEQIMDLASYYANRLVKLLTDRRKVKIKEYKELRDKATTDREKQGIEKKLLKFIDRKKGLYSVAVDMTVPELVKALKADLQSCVDSKGALEEEARDRLEETLNGDAEFYNMILEFALPEIENMTGIHIQISKNSIEDSSTEEEKQANAEDSEGKDSPEMGWSYNHRFVDPFSKLSKSVKMILGGIEMRDPQDMRRYVTDTMGQRKKWNAAYIYACVMSRMARECMADADNFYTIIPYEELSDSEKKNYPLGKPKFHLLEKMTGRYSWAQDLIRELTKSYSRSAISELYPGVKAEELRNDPIKMAEIGNTVSAFYTNFNEQFIRYYTMVNGQIIDESIPTGEQSLKETTVSNYQGNVQFKGIAMVYNTDLSVNQKNLEKTIEKVEEINKKLSPWQGPDGKTHYSTFFDSVKELKELADEKGLVEVYNQMMDSKDKEDKKVMDTLGEISDVLKACGLEFSIYDLFGMYVYPSGREGGLGSLLMQYKACLNSLVGLPEGDHMFESSFAGNVDTTTEGRASGEFSTPAYNWNKLFKSFGDFVTEREYQSSIRILGKSMYPYTHHSFKSILTLNLTNPDPKERRRYIEEHFMQYDWFYDKNKGEFKNTLLQRLYTVDNVNDILTQGHDMLAIKDGYDEKEYSQWGPEEIYRLMFRELTSPVKRNGDDESGCFLMPVPSDSQVCSAIHLPTQTPVKCYDTMLSIVRQELDRMRMVESRNIILKMQLLDRKINKEKRKVDDKEKAYYDKHFKFYSDYRKSHPEDLQEIENFDANGSKFCFFPELNDLKYSYDSCDKEHDTFMMGIIRLLSKDPNNPNKTLAVSLKDIINYLESLSEERYRNLAPQLGITGKSSHGDDEGITIYDTSDTILPKSQLIDRVIKNALYKVMRKKVMNFTFKEGRQPNASSWGEPKDEIVSAMCESDDKLKEMWSKIPTQRKDGELSPEEETKIREFNEAVYYKATNFYLNHTAGMAMYIQLMATDLAYYKDPTKFSGSVDIAKRWKEVNGAGIRLNTNSKYGKKYENNLILVDSIRRSRSYDVLDRVLQDAVDDGRITKDEKSAVINKFKKITGTDAQALRSLTSFRDIMDMAGRYSDELAKSIYNLEHNQWTMSDFYTVYNTLKPFTFGPEEQDAGVDDIKLRTMIQHKNSEAVLLAIYTTLIGSHKGDPNYSAKLRGINKAMEKIELVDENGEKVRYATGEVMKAIDVVQYESAVKVGAQGKVDINYSRTKLNKKLKEARKNGEENNRGAFLVVHGNEIDIDDDSTYYTIADAIGELYDKGKITFEQYNEAMDEYEPGENEVYEIIRHAIYKNGDASLGYDRQILHRIEYKYYSIQQPTDDHYTDVNDGVFGSQPRHIIMADLPENFEITINKKKYKSREELRERYNGLIVANLIDCYVNEIEPLFKDTDDSKGTPIQRLQKRLLAIINQNPKYGKNIKEALELIPDGKGDYTFALPLNNSVLTKQLEELFTSLFKTAIAHQTIKGGNAIIAADVGYSDYLKVRGGKRDKNGKLLPGGKIEGVECLLPACSKDMFEPFLEDRVAEDGTTYKVLDIKKLHDAGMDKIVGYRIPTEGLYSIMPLIVKGFLPQQSGSSIVIAQEVTTLTGSDNDVDKMFLMIKAFVKEQIEEENKETGEKKKKVNIRAMGSPGGDKTLHPLDMSKEQRDNEIIDIFFGVTTHPAMSHLWINPGNFDTLKFNERRLRVLKDYKLRKIFIEKAGLKGEEELVEVLSKPMSQDAINALYRKVFSVPKEKSLDRNMTMFDILDKFNKEFNPPLSPVYPDTFVEMHKMYMAGVAEKGIFANNTLDHAKLQWANVKLMPDETFTFNGNKVEKLDERTVDVKKDGRIYKHYISKDCAECSAAAVDNGKDPVLAGLNSNQRTANLFGYMLRLGLGIENTALLLAQPDIDYMINHSGAIKKKDLQRRIKQIGDWLAKAEVDVRADDCNWHLHNFTTEELYANLIGDSVNKMLQSNNSAYANKMKSLYRAYSLVYHLVEQNSALQAPRNVLHYDSPNHAIGVDLGSAIAQVKEVESVNEREKMPSFERYFTGDERLLSAGMSNIMDQFKSDDDKKMDMFNSLMNCELPIPQAFYTLGIEKARSEFAPYFAFGRPEIQKLTDNMWNYMEDMGIYRLEDKQKIISQMYRDWVVFRLSDTELFGDDGKQTFDEKRQYYLNVFPQKFLELKNDPEMMEFEAFRRLFVDREMIKMNRGSKMDPTLRDFITNSFDKMLTSDNEKIKKVAKDLFMYSYYLNGLDFTYMSFGNFFSTEFQRAFPEYIQALDKMNKEIIQDDWIDNFFTQFIAKRNNMGLLQYFKQTESQREETLQNGMFVSDDKLSNYNSLDDAPAYAMLSSNKNGKTRYRLAKLSPSYSQLYGVLVYIPFSSNTSLHYNANQTLDEMADVVYNRTLTDNKKQVTVTSNTPHKTAEEFNDMTKGPENNDFSRVSYESEYDPMNVDSKLAGALAGDAIQSIIPPEAALLGKANTPNVPEGTVKRVLDQADDQTLMDMADQIVRQKDKLETMISGKTPTPNVNSDIMESLEKIENDNNGQSICLK